MARNDNTGIVAFIIMMSVIMLRWSVYKKLPVTPVHVSS